MPNSDPTPAVTAIASAPQKVTRKAPTITPAPPARAVKPPRIARNINELPATIGKTLTGEATVATRRGMIAPTAKLSLRITTDVYMQAVGPQKREAQSNLVKLVRRGAVSEIKPA